MRDRGPTDRVLVIGMIKIILDGSGGVYEGQKQRWRYCLGWKAFTNKKKSRSNGRSTTQLLTLFQSLSTSSSSSLSSRSFFLSSSATLAEHLSTAQPAIMKSQFLKSKSWTTVLISMLMRDWMRENRLYEHTHLSTQNLFNYCTTTKLLPLPLSTTITIRRQ